MHSPLKTGNITRNEIKFVFKNFLLTLSNNLEIYGTSKH